MSTKDSSENTEIRLHIGSISNQLASDEAALKSRLEKYGEIIKPLEFHQKPTQDTKFAYVTMKMSQANLGSLKKALNGFKFKGSVLTINQAKPDWTQRWAQDQARPNPRPTRDQCIRKYETPNREIDIIPGRMRTVKRKYRSDKKMTVRIWFGDRLKKTWNLPKKKLWGMMKERKLEHLVHDYSHGKWRDGNGDIVEVVDFSVKPWSKSTPSSKSFDLTMKAKDEELEDGDEEAREERERNENILQSMFGASAGDIPAPMQLDSDEEFPIETKKSYNDNDDDDEDFDWDNLKRTTHPAPEEGLTDIKSEQHDEETEDINSTSRLRSLFNPTTEASSFSLFGNIADDEDIQDDVVMADPVETPAIEIKAPAPSKAKNSDDSTTARPYAPTVKGLFFPHFDSPFLSAQSQISTLSTFTFDKEEWEKKFFDTRAEWSSKFKKRRKGVVKQIQKSNKHKRRTIEA